MASGFTFVPSQNEERSRMSQNNRKTKLEDSKNLQGQPPKRAALRTITNQARIQPSRAAKQSSRLGSKEDAASSSRLDMAKSAPQAFAIHMDTETSYADTTSTVLRQTVQSTAAATVCSTTNFSNENEGAFSRSSKSAFAVPLQQTRQNFRIHVDAENIPPTSATSTTDSSSLEKDLPSSVVSLSRSPLAEISVSTSMDDTSLASEESMVIASSDDEDDVAEDEVRTEPFNIDSRADIVVDVPEYATEIHENFKQSELKRRPKLSNLKRQQEITLNMRAILVEWLVEVAEEYRLKPQTLHLTVNYLDRFLSYMSVEKNKLQLVGVSCMLIAAKYEEIYPPEPSDFAHMTDNSYTTRQILRMEHCILKVLDFGMTVPTCLDFLERYLKVPNVPKHFVQKLTDLSMYLCELSLLDAEPFLKYLPSVIATSSAVLALHTLGFEPWGPSFEHYTGFQYERIQSCVQDLHRAFAHAPRHPQQFIRQKYQSERFNRVGHHTPPGSLPTVQFVQTYQVMQRE